MFTIAYVSSRQISGRDKHVISLAASYRAAIDEFEYCHLSLHRAVIAWTLRSGSRRYENASQKQCAGNYAALKPVPFSRRE